MLDFDLNGGFGLDVLKNAPQEKEKVSFKDERFFKLTRDEEGNGSAIIRLMTDKNKIPYTKMYHYSSSKQIGGKKYWLIENSPSTLKEYGYSDIKCPIAEHYFDLIAMGQEEEAKKHFGRKVKYICNIFVVKNNANPDTEGKVFLFEFGRKLKEKFDKWMSESSDELSFSGGAKDLYHPIKGHDVLLKIAEDKNSGFFHYDFTEVSPNPTRVGGLNDEQLKDLFLNKTYDLSEFQRPEYFKPYDDIKKRLNYFINPFDKAKEASKSVAEINLDDTPNNPSMPTETFPNETDTKSEVKVTAKSDTSFEDLLESL